MHVRTYLRHCAYLRLASSFGPANTLNRREILKKRTLFALPLGRLVLGVVGKSGWGRLVDVPPVRTCTDAHNKYEHDGLAEHALSPSWPPRRKSESLTTTRMSGARFKNNKIVSIL